MTHQQYSSIRLLFIVLSLVVLIIHVYASTSDIHKNDIGVTDELDVQQSHRHSPRYRAIPSPNDCTRQHTVDPLTIIDHNTCRRCCGSAFSQKVHARAPLTPLMAKHFHPEAFATTCHMEDNSEVSMCCDIPGTNWQCVAIKD